MVARIEYDADNLPLLYLSMDVLSVIAEVLGVIKKPVQFTLDCEKVVEDGDN